MKKVILFMVGVLASLMLSAQSRWSVTPEAGLVVNKENEGRRSNGDSYVCILEYPRRKGRRI